MSFNKTSPTRAASAPPTLPSSEIVLAGQGNPTRRCSSIPPAGPIDALPVPRLPPLVSASVYIAIANGSEFAFFPSLPLELRQMIWKLALPKRMLTIYWRGKQRRNGTYAHKVCVHQPHRKKIFKIKHSCSEAWHWIHPLYHKIRLPYLGWRFQFNPSLDTLYFQKQNMPWTMPSFSRIIRDMLALDPRISIASITIDESLIRNRHAAILAARDHVDIIVGAARGTSKYKEMHAGVSGTKLLTPASQWNKTGTKDEKAARAVKFEALMTKISEVGGDMPVIRIMRLSEAEWEIYLRRVSMASWILNPS